MSKRRATRNNPIQSPSSSSDSAIDPRVDDPKCLMILAAMPTHTMTRATRTHPIRTQLCHVQTRGPRDSCRTPRMASSSFRSTLQSPHGPPRFDFCAGQQQNAPNPQFMDARDPRVRFHDHTRTRTPQHPPGPPLSYVQQDWHVGSPVHASATP